MSNRNVEQISWGEAARRGAKDFVWDVLPKSALSSFIAESLVTVRNALNMNFPPDGELRTIVGGVVAGGNYLLRRQYKTIEVPDGEGVKKVKVPKYDQRRPPVPRGLRADFDYDAAEDIVRHSPRNLEVTNLKHYMRVSESQALALLAMRRDRELRTITALFESAKMGAVVLNTVAMPAVLNSSLPWEHKALLIGGLATVQVGLFTLIRKMGILPETTTLPENHSR